jgi:signal transduction histidine kinase
VGAPPARWTELPPLAAATAGDRRTGTSPTSTTPREACHADHLPITSYLAVRWSAQRRYIGALVFSHAQPGAFTGETERRSPAWPRPQRSRWTTRGCSGGRDLITALGSNRELDQFAYVASHDLKAPLRGIANLSQWIEDDLGDRLDDQTRTHIHLLRGRVIRLENLIGGILAYSRAGRDSSEHATVDLAALVTEVWELLRRPTVPTSGAAAVLKTSRSAQQILIHLIGNALKYNGPPAGVRCGAPCGRHEFSYRQRSGSRSSDKIGPVPDPRAPR